MMLDKLMGYCQSHRYYEEGIGYVIRSLKVDLSRECTHRRMMRLYTIASDRSSALRQYEQCATYLRKELNVEPAARTQELYERICNNEPLTNELAVKQAQRLQDKSLPANVDFSRLLSHLAQLTADLDSACCRIQQDIKAITEFLQGT